jgi:putative inorganic carbon (hco3(-)) transporter
MANDTHDFLFPGSGLPVSGEALEGFRGHKAALALGLAGSAAAALFVSAHVTIALVGAMAVLFLSAIESEAFLLFVIYLTPFVWVLQGDMLLRNVSVALRSLVVVGFFAGRLLRGQARIGRLLRPTVSRASLLFLCAAIAPTVWQKGGQTYDSVRALYQLATFVAFYFVVLAWADSRQRIRRVLWAVSLSTIATAVFAFYQQMIGGYTSLWLYLIPQDEYSVPWAGRSNSFMAHANNLAGYLNLVLPFALACCVLGLGKWKKLGAWTLGLGFLALVSTQSVGGLVGFVAILVLAIFCFARSGKQRILLLTGVLTSVCLVYFLRSILNPSHTEEAVGWDVVTRLILWATAWDYFIHSPVVGVGWGNFTVLYGSDVPSFIPPGQLEVHNVYLQLLAETGLLGFIAFSSLVIRAWRQAWTQWRSSVDFLDLALAFGVLGALLSLLVQGFIEIPFFTQSGTLFWVLLALLVASSRLQRESVAGSVPVP